MRPSPKLRLLGLLGALGLAAAGCGGAQPSAAAQAGRASLPLPLPTSFSSGSTSFAIVPMGYLSTRLNVFWQLFRQSSGSSRWTLDTPEGVGDQGGLVTGTSPSSSGDRVVIGFLASNLLGFSPLAASKDDGSSWSGSVLPKALTPGPSDLSMGSPRNYALVGKDGATLLTSAGTGSWQKYTSLAALSETAAGRRCGVKALTAVLGESGGTLIGATCSKRSATGLFSLSGGRLTAVHLSSGALAGASQVLGIYETSSATDALVAERGSRGTSLVVLRESAGAWRTSAQLQVHSYEHVQSVLGGASGQLAVLLAQGSPAHPAVERLESMGPSLQKWQLVARPPAGTQTVAWGRDGSLVAFSPHNSLLTLYSSDSGSWSKLEQLRVPIQYGSAG